MQKVEPNDFPVKEISRFTTGPSYRWFDKGGRPNTRPAGVREPAHRPARAGGNL